jgi:superfamily II DNA or RNA helicase
VLEYFGGICYEYTMKQAMKDGHLSPYDYNIILLNLNDQETQAYLELSLEISRKFQMNFADQGEIDDSLKILLIRRAKLIANAENKILALDNVLKNLTMPVKKAIFYCGEGGSQNEIGMTERQIDKVTSLIGTTHNCAIRKFTYEESIEDREEIIDNLKIGQLDGVVAMRCLDEGIDLPELNMGFFLASSSNPRQFIQRRGRLLRKAPGKEKAIIYDFMVEPPDFGGDLYENAYNMEREFLKKELKRIVEFCNLAKNGVTQLVKLQDLRKKYDLIAL